MSFNTFTKELNYPLFGLQFIDNNTFAVSGGGGEGRHGIPNGLDIFQITNKQDADNKKKDSKPPPPSQQPVPDLLKPKELKLIGEFKYDKNTSDAPMSLAYHKPTGTAYLGCNDGKTIIETTSTNHDLKALKISDNGTKVGKSQQYRVFPNKVEGSSYIKKIEAHDLGKLVMLSSDAVSRVYVNDITSLDNPSVFEAKETQEIKDFSIKKSSNDDDKALEFAYVTKSTGKIVNVVAKKSPVIKDLKLTAKECQLLRIKYLSSTKLLILGASPNKQIIAYVYCTATDKVINRQVLVKNVKSVNAVDFAPFNNNNTAGLLAVATSDLSVVLYHVALDGGYKIVKIFEFPRSHAFAVTNIAIEENLNHVVSVSAANSIHVIELPSVETLESLKDGGSMLWWIILMILVLIIAMYLANAQ
ncbi:hypothetical protein DASC09_048160 [Saccharomycopsis crataegensis]|uniref:Guanine nucleotide-exchange factor SEC12 n=1 Tax=Saccharomycopsis crataegensis TaxID=43959 RepID=A0AAV5QSI6_9ASCO|nr:hypothetical protein DASC09_048160 [Saccharomycopsis crataegensis]